MEDVSTGGTNLLGDVETQLRLIEELQCFRRELPSIHSWEELFLFVRYHSLLVSASFLRSFVEIVKLPTP